MRAISLPGGCKLALILFVISSLLFLFGLPLLEKPGAVAQTVPPVLIGPKVQAIATWDRVTTDIDGNPETISGYELAITPDASMAPDSPQAVLASLTTTATGYGGTDITPMFASLPPGPLYIFVRAKDEAGNLSGWSEPVELRYDPRPPQIPKNIRITLQITIKTP